MSNMKELKSFTDEIWSNCSDTLVDKLVSIQDKIAIREKINRLKNNEMLYIFQIIINANEEYSENNNGVFIDLNTLKYDTIIEITEYLDKVFENKEDKKIKFILEK